MLVLFSDESEGGLSIWKNMSIWRATTRSYCKENVEIGACELAKKCKGLKEWDPLELLK